MDSTIEQLMERLDNGLPPVPEQCCVAVALSDLVCNYPADPHNAARAIRWLVTENPTEFLRAATGIFRTAPPGPGRQYLLGMLIEHDLHLMPLCEPEWGSLEAAKELARDLAAVQPDLDSKLAQRLMAEEKKAGDPRSDAVVQRVLALIEETSGGGRILPSLVRLLGHANPRVRSKAMLLFARAKKDGQWVQRVMREPEARVRANAVEAMWGADSKDAVVLFARAFQDPHHRVVANALIGLYLVGDTEAPTRIREMGSHAGADFRAAAAWAMGHTCDARFLPALNEMFKDPEGAVRRNVLRALVKIRNRQRSEKSDTTA